MTYRLYDEALEEQIKASDSDRWLVLENHPTLVNWWLVNSTDPRFRARMGDTINRFQAVGPFSWDTFAAKAREQGYQIAFFDDPAPTFAWLESLYQPVGVTITSTLPGVNQEGMFPFQRVGVNMMRHLMGGMLQWSTGTGKSVGANALVALHKQERNFDLCLFVCKRHNRINVHRSLRRMVGLDSYILSGSQGRRDRVYMDVGLDLLEGRMPILVMNYEPFRNDLNWFKVLVENQRVLVMWDEMSAKLRNRGTQLYRAVAEVFYTSQTGKNHIYYPQDGKQRPAELRQYALTATPIYKNPEDFLNVIRLIDPAIWPSTADWQTRFVSKWDYWALRRGERRPIKFRDTDLMGAETAHIVHQVDKHDPDVAKWFPQVMEQTLDVELHEQHRALYDKLQTEYREKDLGLIEEDELLSAVQCLQMLASNPAAVLESARAREAFLEASRKEEVHWQDQGYQTRDREGKPVGPYGEWVRKHKRGNQVARKFVALIANDERFLEKKGDEPKCAKMAAMLDLVESNDDKTIVFTRMNRTVVPYLAEWFDRRDIGYVVYAGGMTAADLQATEDAFKTDPAIKVFLSTDAGSDSIDLEMANLTINFDLPWDWATHQQRSSRQNRITSTHEHQRVVNLIAADTVDERVQEIVEQKRIYHEGVLKGEIAEQSQGFRRSDLLYVLTGNQLED